MNKLILFAAIAASAASAQITIPDGTKLRVRLEQTISSATADEGQAVSLSVTEAVKLDGQVVIPEGAAVTGTITVAQEKRRMGRAGKLDFSIDRARAVDGEWVPLRYTLNKKSGESHAVRTGVLTAGAAVVFWPAAPVFLLMHGKDVTINKGVTFDVFTDNNHALANLGQKAANPTAPPATAPATQPAQLSQPGGSATVVVAANVSGCDIEVDGGFVGSTPTTLQLPAGTHQVSVKNGLQVWERKLLVTAGSNISLNAVFTGTTARAGR